MLTITCKIRHIAKDKTINFLPFAFAFTLFREHTTD
jgi:hypothetical protein